MAQMEFDEYFCVRDFTKLTEILNVTVNCEFDDVTVSEFAIDWNVKKYEKPKIMLLEGVLWFSFKQTGNLELTAMTISFVNTSGSVESLCLDWGVAHYNGTDYLADWNKKIRHDKIVFMRKDNHVDIAFSMFHGSVDVCKTIPSCGFVPESGDILGDIEADLRAARFRQTQASAELIRSLEALYKRAELCENLDDVRAEQLELEMQLAKQLDELRKNTHAYKTMH